MVPEIPVCSRKKFDIGPKGNEPAAGLEAAFNLVKGAAERRFVRQVLEKIAGKNKVQRTLRKRPGERAILQEALHLRIEALRGIWIQVHRIFGAALNLINEFAVTAAEIEHCGRRTGVALKASFDQHLPDPLPIIRAGLETGFINAPKSFRSMRGHLGSL